jgi:tetratricopeptide (TPR) repeat protein
MALAGSGKRFEAIDACRDAVGLAPGVQRFKAQLAGMYVQADQAADAVRLLEAVNTEQADLVHLGTLGDAYYLNGEYSKAAGIYETIAKRWPLVPLTYFRLSGVYDYLERSAEANAAAKKFAELEPKLAISHFNLGVRLQSSGLFFESIDALLKTIDLDRTNGLAYLALSESYETVGDNDNLLGSLRHAYKYLPERSFELCYRFGTLLGESGSHAEAIEPLEQAFEMKPVPQVMRSLGLAYVAGGEYEKGVDLIEKANELSPLPPGMTMTFNRDRRNQMLARFDGIVEEVKRSPDSIQAHSAAHEVYLYKRLTKEAEKHGLEIIRLHPENYNSYNGMGIFYSNIGDIEKALAMTQKAIELKPNHVLYITASFHLKKLGRIDEAIDALRKSIAIKPLPETPLLLGDLLLKKGNRQEALKEFQAGLQVAPNDPRPHFRLAWLYIRMGDREGAVRHYRTLKTLAPHMVGALEMSILGTFGSLN